MRGHSVIRPEQVVEFFLSAYRHGAFPMADPGSPVAASGSIINWYSPDPRAILPLDAVHVPRSLKRLARKPPFTFTSDTCFERVIRACAEPRSGRAGEPDNLPWLNEPLIRAYCLLHQAGHAHSIEAWLSDRQALVGGIYGVHIGGAFFAESMFCRPALGGSNASNLCLLRLVAHLRARGFRLLDVQIANEHTRRFGVIEIPRTAYLQSLTAACVRTTTWIA